MTRCSCHPRDCYGGCIRCPKCHHWSYDPGIGCERRKCAYEEPPEQQMELFA